jgi:glyoxylase-like metal-dependent hydrolase (beta-lactamase superfamily II)
MTNRPLNAVIVPVTAFQQNCTLLWCTRTMRGAFVDPGGDLDRLMATADKHGVTIEKLLVTHGHVDHAAAVADLRDVLTVPVEGPAIEDNYWIMALNMQIIAQI